MNRKTFLIQSALSTSGIFAAPQLVYPKLNLLPEKGAALDIALVKEFVVAANKDPAKAKTMLAETPDLLNAVNNLGGWDWQDALGAAGPVGIHDLANFLLEKGARLTICVSAIFGKIEIVKSQIETFPYLKDSAMPYNISLMRHAKVGREDALMVLDYLKSIGTKSDYVITS